MPARSHLLRRPVGGTQRRWSRLLPGLLLVVSLPACSDDPVTPDAEPPDRSTAPVQEVDGWQLQSRVTRVAGRLPAKERDRVASRVGRVVRDHLEAAYLGDYPMRRAPGAFADFTPGARKLAVRDRAVLTGKGLRGAESVGVDRAGTYVAVLAPRRQLVGATARLDVDLLVDTGDGEERVVRVRGRLMLTPTTKGWKVFGYDVSRSGLGKRGADQPRSDGKDAR